MDIVPATGVEQSISIGNVEIVPSSSLPIPTASDMCALPPQKGLPSWFHEYIARQIHWSRRTFGDGPRTKGLIAHIRKECDEVLAKPDDLEERIDLIILALDGAWRCGSEEFGGYDPEQIIMMLELKQKKNQLRQWPIVGPDEAAEHIRETKEGIDGNEETSG